MISKLVVNNKCFTVDLSHSYDLSLPLSPDPKTTRAWYVDSVKIEPVRTEHFLGSVAEGGNVNFRNVSFNPHGNGTHTECVGHIAKEVYSLNDFLKTFWFHTLIITVEPEEITNDTTFPKGDFIIRKSAIENALKNHQPQALVIRTLPNDKKQKHFTNYSNTNPAYLEPDAAQFIVDNNIDHLLIDLPSIDREEDGGELLAHHIFWEYPKRTQFHRTISELLYIDNTVPDGEYIMNLMITSLVNDASPSKPIVYPIIPE